ncbi:zinc finger, CCHC-type containing protein [Tanacetum coccineum]
MNNGDADPMNIDNKSDDSVEEIGKPTQSEGVASTSRPKKEKKTYLQGEKVACSCELRKEAQTEKTETEKVQTKTEGGNQERDRDRVLPEKESKTEDGRPKTADRKDRRPSEKVSNTRKQKINVGKSIKGLVHRSRTVQKAKMQILRNELEMLKMNDNESINDFADKISSIVAKFKSLGSLEEEVIVRKFLNSVTKKYLPIVAPIEQYSDLETMTFEEAVGRVKAYEERLQSLEAKDEDQGQLMMASEEKHGENSGRGRGRGRNFERGGRGRGRGRGRGDKSGIRCYDCGEFGHFSYECTKWKDKDEANLIQDEEPALL